MIYAKLIHCLYFIARFIAWKAGTNLLIGTLGGDCTRPSVILLCFLYDTAMALVFWIHTSNIFFIVDADQQQIPSVMLQPLRVIECLYLSYRSFRILLIFQLNQHCRYV